MSSTTEPADALIRADLYPDIQLLRMLGSGSTSEVFLGRQPALERLVAVKVLRAEFAQDTVLRRRFEREARSAARVISPNIPAIYQVGLLSTDVPYIVMEYVEGRTLGEMLASHASISQEYAHALLGQVAAALAAAHACGVVHRDVHPGNIIIENSTGRAVLTDFGLAALQESGTSAETRLTMLGETIGSVRYMSPEQCQGESPTAQTDIYAFGVLAFDMLTGQAALVQDSSALSLHHSPVSQIGALRSIGNDIEPALASIIQRCLAAEPARRPLSRELAQEFTTALASQRSGKYQASGFDEFLNEMSRRRVYKVLIAYGTLTGGVVGLGKNFVEIFNLSFGTYRVLVLVTLLGFPIALVLAWLYDVRSGRILRTMPANGASQRSRFIGLSALGLTVAAVALIAWLVLHRHA